MLVLRCTRTLRDELKLKTSDLVDAGTGVLGSWFGNLFRIERRKCVLFTNDRTLYSVLLFGLRKQDFDSIDERFRAGLWSNLIRDGFSPDAVAAFEKESSPVVWAATNSRSVLGSMNDMIFLSKHLVGTKRRRTEDEIVHLNSELNRTPMSALKRIVAFKEMEAALEEFMRGR